MMRRHAGAYGAAGVSASASAFFHLDLFLTGSCRGLSIALMSGRLWSGKRASALGGGSSIICSPGTRAGVA
jgi:hypothetical protein